MFSTAFDCWRVAAPVNSDRQTCAAWVWVRTWKRMETTAPQISSPTMNCSPSMARMMFSQNLLARPLRRRMIHLPPLRLDSSWRADRRSQGATGRWEAVQVWDRQRWRGRGLLFFFFYLPHGFDPLLEQVEVTVSAQVTWTHQMTVEPPELLHLTHSTRWWKHQRRSLRGLLVLWMQPGLDAIQNVFMPLIFAWWFQNN